MKKFRTKLILVCALVLLFGGSHIAASLGAVPANNNCQNAQPIGNVTNLPFDTTSATFDGPGYCMNSPNIWYRYTAPHTGCTMVSLCGSNYDTKLAIYRGGNCNPALSSLMICNDDFCDRQSQATFPAVAGGQYLIEIGGYNPSDVGQGVLSITYNPQVTPPSNDDCQNAQAIGNVTNRMFDTTCATFDGPGHFITNQNIWYRYTATCTGNVTVSLCDSSFDTMLAVYRGGSCYPTASSMIGSNDDFCSEQSQVTFLATAGQQYLIEIGGYNSAEIGWGEISISCAGQPGPSPVPNDDCVNAQYVGNVTNLVFDTTRAAFDGPGHCMTSKNIWYRYTATCTGNVKVSLCGSSFDTMLAVYRGSSCNPRAGNMIGCNDDFCGLQSEITFAATVGSGYLIEVGGCTDSDYGQGVLNITCSGQPGPSPVPNDDCVNAQSVGNVTNLPFDTTLATFDGPGHCMTSKNIWYRYTAICTDDVTVSLCGSSYDTKLAVYRGGSCNPAASNMIGCNDDACGQQSQITFTATAGQRYLIEVGGYSSNYGQGVLTISCAGPAPGESDLGDAPDSTNNSGVAMTAYPKGGPTGVQANYPTVFNDSSGVGPYGPIHLNPLAVAHLGKKTTVEAEADTGTDQDVVNNINPLTNTPDRDGFDDGVIFPVGMPHCRWTTFDYIVKVINPGTDLWVNVWCDWNRDGDWNDDSNTDPSLSCTTGFVSEWAVQNQYLFNLSAGLHQLTTPAFLSWHPQYGAQQIWMRITLSEQPWKGGSGTGTRRPIGGSGPQSGYEYGETEDYYFLPDVTSSICDDFNSDGIINMQDLSAFTAEWLENCQ